MGLLSILSGAAGATAGAFYKNPFSSANWLSKALPQAMVGAGIGFGAGALLESTTTEKAPSKPYKLPDPPVTILDVEDTAKSEVVKAAGDAERKKVAAMRGRKSTILTGPRGLLDDEADIRKVSILGA